MKEKAIYRGLLAAGMLLLAACTDEEFVREAGTQPDPDALTEISATLYRTDPVAGRVILSEGDATDVLRCRLSLPAPQGTELTLTVDEAAVERYNEANGTELTLFPADKVTLFYEKSLPAGAKESGDFRVTFQREGVEKGRYLLPVTLTVSGLVGYDASLQTVYYTVEVFDKIPESSLDVLPVKIVGYVNTAEMSPIIGIQFECDKFDTWDFETVVVTWLDIEILRRATIVDKAGRVTLTLDPDLQYVSDNRVNYIRPVQKSGRKVLFCVQGGGSGVGFRNLTDEQIADFVWQLNKVVTDYGYDGVNFMDTDAGYDKEGAPAIVSGSYAKLIKATKEAVGDKMVTIACDAESTEELSKVQDGIEAGKYIDYAWPAIFDKTIDAYAEGAELKPIAGLEQSKYGGALLETHNTSWNAVNKQKRRDELMTLFRETKSANIIAFWDMPPSQAGIERGAVESFTALTDAMSDWDGIYDSMGYEAKLKPSSVGYWKFIKDW